jgi:hypothetical protein
MAAMVQGLPTTSRRRAAAWRRAAGAFGGIAAHCGKLVRLLGGCGAAVTLWCGSVGRAEIDFNRQVRPILSSRCFPCHGPDAATRAADLRLDLPDDALADRGGYAAIVAGAPERSELLRRVTHADPGLRMPPPETKTELRSEEIALLESWVREGARWQLHWSLEPIVPPPVPAPPGSSDAAHPIDRFLAAGRGDAGLVPSPRAAPATLLRRVHLDLTGLPPTPEEAAAFAADPSDAAWRRIVRRLLESPHCAERLALDWLDGARYADTNGFSIDDHRDMWAYRDWVIDAFARNMPFDRFLIEQLAGDLLPEATDRQRLATGFLRNSMNTHEGGTIAEEYRVAGIADKVDAVATVCMGLTLKCAQCHEHKYDPFTQEDYYRFFAFFDRTDEPGVGAVNGNTEPVLRTESPLADAERLRTALNDRLAALEAALRDAQGPLQAPFAAWQHAQSEQWAADDGGHAPSFPEALRGEPLPEWIWSERQAATAVWFRRSFPAPAANAAARLWLACDNAAVIWLNGREIGRTADWRQPATIELGTSLQPGENVLAIAARNADDGSMAGLAAALRIDGPRPQGTDAPRPQWIVSDGSWRCWTEEPEAWRGPPEPAGGAAVRQVRPYGAEPWGRPHLRGDAAEADLVEAVRTPPKDRSSAQVRRLAEAYAQHDPEFAKLRNSVLEEMRVLEEQVEAGQTTVMVMREADAPRTTRLLRRGAYDQPGPAVTPGIPAVFGSLPTDAPHDRLALARWLASPRHPLTARVAVNRYWQLLFGTGLVRTSEDFGSQGEMPSHPELLDWLAADFVAHGWDVRRLLEQIVTTHSYALGSETSETARERDPENRLLARSPRVRLPAELVRDNALAIGGLLDRTVGGPSVYPVQPDGLWRELSHYGHPTVFTAQNFYADQGARLRRRSLYTFWKRTAPPPALVLLDAPNREVCTVRRQRTNTPLQALLLLNEAQFVTAARGLAAEALRAGSTDDERLAYAFRKAVVRAPSETEQGTLRRALDRQRSYFRERPHSAAAFNAFGIADVAAEDDPREVAALTGVASLILNLDETMTRE